MNFFAEITLPKQGGKKLPSDMAFQAQTLTAQDYPLTSKMKLKKKWEKRLFDS